MKGFQADRQGAGCSTTCSGGAGSHTEGVPGAWGTPVPVPCAAQQGSRPEDYCVGLLGTPPTVLHPQQICCAALVEEAPPKKGGTYAYCFSSAAIRPQSKV